MFIVVPLWVLLLPFVIATPTGFRVVAALACALIGVFVLVAIGTAVGDANRTAAMETGAFDCRGSVASNDFETYTRSDVWSYCSGAFGSKEQWQAFLDADRDRRDAEFAQRRTDDEAASNAKDHAMVELGQRSLKR